MYNNTLDCKITNYANLVAIMQWDTKKDSLFVEEGRSVSENKFKYRTLPSIAPKSFDTDTIRKVTETTVSLLNGLFSYLANAKAVLLDNGNGDLTDAAQTIQIFIAFWKQENIEKLEKIKTDADLEDKASWTPRPEAKELIRLLPTLINTKELPASCLFKAHVGRNTSGLIVSETIYKNRTSPAERYIYRISGTPYKSSPSYSYSSSYESGCLRSTLSFELHSKYEAYKDRIIWKRDNEKNGPVIVVDYFPICGDEKASHSCPAYRAGSIFRQLIAEINPSMIVVNHERSRETAKSALSSQYGNSDTLARPHPFFAAIAPKTNP